MTWDQLRVSYDIPQRDLLLLINASNISPAVVNFSSPYASAIFTFFSKGNKGKGYRGSFSLHNLYGHIRKHRVRTSCHLNCILGVNCACMTIRIAPGSTLITIKWCK